MQRLTPHEDDILRTLKKHKLSISQIEDKMFTFDRPSRRTISRILDGLVAIGYIKKSGMGRGTKYELSEKSA